MPITPQQALTIVESAAQQVGTVVNSVATQMQNVATTATSATGGMSDAANGLAQAVNQGTAQINAALQEAIRQIQGLGSQAEQALRDLIANIPQVEIPAEIKINGVAIASPVNPDDLYRRIIQAVDATNRAPVSIRIEGPLAGLLTPLTMSKEDRRKFVLRFGGIDPASVILTPNPADWVIVACVICVCVVIVALGLGGPLVLGTGAVLFALAIALVVAAIQGRKIDAQVCPDLGVGAALFEEVMSKVNLKTCVVIAIT